MRDLHRLYEGDEDMICAAYARAEFEGRAFRKRGDYSITSDDYAKALLTDGKVKGWLK